MKIKEKFYSLEDVKKESHFVRKSLQYRLRHLGEKEEMLIFKKEHDGFYMGEIQKDAYTGAKIYQDSEGLIYIGEWRNHK